MATSEGTHLTFWEHIAVLRKYILIGGIFFFISSAAIFGYRIPITRYLLVPLHGEPLIFLSPMGPFLFEIHISFVGGLIISFPLWLFLLSRFAGEALPSSKRWRFLWFVLVAAVLGAGSLLVSYYFLVPTSFQAFSHFLVPGTSFMLTADSYVNFVFLVTTVCFLVVELPVLIVALAYIRLVDPHFLAKHRRYLYVILLIGLGIVTPTTDVITLLAVTVPALLLTELGLAIAKMIYNREVVDYQ